ncbi:Concanavalin A-like lectin/glucanase, subgroup [Artemisia annua]|uniref:non-specific serine/threonine protein kinase n=1 Tax=Artemisia annua TaxID=35608 RepID=A0A2U1KFQ2_ARTAN|nr:Concanavalin A-like lectin/glucanase, subgroup [Artemisia annua]
MATLLSFVHKKTTLLLFFTWLQFTAIFTILPTTAQNSTTLKGTNNDVDRVALVAVKSLIREDPQNVTSSWNHSLHFCQWQGVTCSRSHQRVTLLDLSSRGLVGSLSPWIGNMSFLRGILLHNNSLNGEIPEQLGRLFRLQDLHLNNNSFEGSIPRSLSNCSNLNILHLGINKLVGRIPNEFGSLTKLRLLIVHKNNIAGGIPSFIGNLTMLDTLSLGGCRLVGSIPDVFHHLKNLKRLAFPENELVGTIPPSIYNLSLLESLFLDNNKLHGTLDANLVLLQPRIQELSLPDNQFTGTLHPSIFNSTELRTLDVSRNKFSGKIVINPPNLCQFVELSLGFNEFGSGETDEMKFIKAFLYFLRLSSNSISGYLPSSIGNLSGLTTLDVSNNQFTGTIPERIGRLENLRRLELKENNFAGNIPEALGNLPSLIELHIGMNKFNGTIPSSIGNCKNLIVLTLEQNHLTGIIPKSLFGLTSLSISLNLGGNYLSGQLPVEMGNDLSNLNELILAENRLSGELPSSIGSCSSLQNLDIRGNFFQGSLPSTLRSLRALENLDLSFNNFTGLIPRFLELLHLESLNMSFNGFEGEVSRKGVFANVSAISVEGNSGLCGGIPELHLPKCSSNRPKGSNKLSLGIILVIAFVAILFFVATVTFAFFCWRRRKGDDVHHTANTVDEMPLIKISYKMLYDATNAFSVNNVIGKGSYASVYRGELDFFSGIVAIKVLNLHRQGGSKSFISECEALRNARHRNLVKVVSCCSGSDFEGNEFKALVYEFLHNGSLDRWLHPSHTIENMQIEVPRLKYGLGSKVSTSGDIYSYGVLLLEMVTGKRPTDPMFNEGLNLHNYANAAMGDRLVEIVDPILLRNNCSDCALSTNKKGEEMISIQTEGNLRMMLELGVACSKELPQQRIDITSVIHELHLIKDVMLSYSTG